MVKALCGDCLAVVECESYEAALFAECPNCGGQEVCPCVHCVRVLDELESGVRGVISGIKGEVKSWSPQTGIR